ncbi:adenosine receptor A3-like isoform X1 [Montipora foliosa]|uniref:adenosine receptor A3-like isoform X1 n=2 Tax=Montipora foliosa TaxID=591990 RepID=UPI0035F20EF6
MGQSQQAPLIPLFIRSKKKTPIENPGAKEIDKITMFNTTTQSTPFFENATSQDTFPLIPVVTTVSFLSFGTILGNSLVVTAVIIHPALHSVTYLSIFSLAVADLLAGIVAMPSYILKKFSLGDSTNIIVCDVFRFSYFLTGYASIQSLSVISVERMLAVKSPLRHKTIVTHRRVVLGLLFAWFDSVIISSLPFIPWDQNLDKECNYSPTRWWSVMVIICNVIVPFMVIVVCYIYLYLKAKSHVKKIPSDRSCSGGNNRLNRSRETIERRVSLTILIVIGVFVASWFPSCFYYFLQTTCPQCFSEAFKPLQGIFNAWVKILTFTSSFANPLIYCWRGKHFRSAFRRILRRMTVHYSRVKRGDSVVKRATCGRGSRINEAVDAFKSKVDEGKYVPKV